MNIVYSSSETYAEICGISIVSLFENNKDAEDIRVFIIDNGISNLNKKRLLNTAVAYKRTIEFVNKVDLDNLTHTHVYTGRWNVGTFFRLYLGSILPLDVERVIYIDCDVIIRHSLMDVYNLDMGDCVVAGVDDCRCDLYREDIGSPKGSTYINNGFMVINLKRWREENLEPLFTQFISNRNGDCTYMDQAPLNGVLCPRKQIYELEPIYNAQRIFFDFSYKQLLKLRKPEYHLSEGQYNQALNDPIVVHFTPTFITGTRPWQKKDKHKFTHEYRYYKEMSEWKEEPLRKDDRKPLKKIMTIVCKCTPRPLMICVMSYLHSFWYPKKRIKYSKKMEKEVADK